MQAALSIEGIINIEQAKSDRNFNQTIFAVGTGLGTSQAATSIIMAQFPAIIKTDDPNYQPAIYVPLVFFGSISVGFIFGLIIWVIMRSRNSPKA